MLQIVFPILIGLALVFSAPCWSRSYGDISDQGTVRERKNAHEGGRTATQNRSENSAGRDQSSYGNNQRLRNNEKKWEKLPPQKQNELHNNMDRFKSLPPEDRKLYQKRFEQMQQLPPDERNDIQNKLRRKDRLSPEEKEEIRKKFE